MDINTIIDSYNLLEVEFCSNLAAIKQGYRDAISIWHPDKYANNERLAVKATEKTKQINNAYTLVVEFFNAYGPLDAYLGAAKNYGEERTDVNSAAQARADAWAEKMAARYRKAGRPDVSEPVGVGTMIFGAAFMGIFGVAAVAANIYEAVTGSDSSSDTNSDDANMEYFLCCKCGAKLKYFQTCTDNTCFNCGEYHVFKGGKWMKRCSVCCGAGVVKATSGNRLCYKCSGSRYVSI
jgi:DnaJ-class molecular chaperone